MYCNSICIPRVCLNIIIIIIIIINKQIECWLWGSACSNSVICQYSN